MSFTNGPTATEVALLEASSDPDVPTGVPRLGVTPLRVQSSARPSCRAIDSPVAELSWHSRTASKRSISSSGPPGARRRPPASLRLSPNLWRVALAHSRIPSNELRRQAGELRGLDRNRRARRSFDSAAGSSRSCARTRSQRRLRSRLGHWLTTSAGTTDRRCSPRT